MDPRESRIGSVKPPGTPDGEKPKNRKGRDYMKAVNIKWDTDGDEKLAKELPSEIEIPDEIIEQLEEDSDAVSDYVSEQTGFCHYGYELVN